MLASITTTCSDNNINTRINTIDPLSNHYIDIMFNTGPSTIPLISDCSVAIVFAPIVPQANYYGVTGHVSTNPPDLDDGNNVIPWYVAVQSGKTAQYTAAPSPGYRLTEITSNCGSDTNTIYSGNQYTTEPITSSCMVLTYFEPAD
jgi:hypothetical protein